MQSSPTQISMPTLVNFLYWKVGGARIRHLATILRLTKDLLLVQLDSMQQHLRQLLSKDKSRQG